VRGSGADGVVDTIVGIATPPGTGAIGVIRVSGPLAVSLCSRLVQLASPGGLDACKERVLHRGAVIDPCSGDELDTALIVRMSAPRSYTGEDVVELSCHGNPVLLAHVVELLVRGGARLAEPGEFTRRAYTSGRMDLLQVEAVAELIGARTERAVRLAARHVRGSLSRDIASCRERLLDLMAGLEVALDFPDEELGMARTEAIRCAEAMSMGLAALIARGRHGRAIQDGLDVMLVGAPNVGKSSVLNALLGRERAIVSPSPGTTRDLLDASLVLAGVPVRLLDGAGLGPPRDALDSEGMRVARLALEDSDLALVVLDASRSLGPADEHVLELTSGRPRLVIANKVDLRWALEERVNVDHNCSALSGGGIGTLLGALEKWVAEQTAPDGEEGGVVASLRALEQLGMAHRAIGSASRALERVPIEAALVDLQDALGAFDRLLGFEADEAVLDRIFSTFCVGK